MSIETGQFETGHDPAGQSGTVVVRGLPMTEVDLRAQLTDHPDKVLSEQMALHHDRLLRLIQFRLSTHLAGRIDPEDIFQESWLAASQRLPFFLENENLSIFVWLRMIVTQTMVDMERKHLGTQKRDPFREQNVRSIGNAQGFNGTVTSFSLAHFLIGNITSPSNAIAKQEQSEKLHQAISAMDEMDREVLALRHFEELTNLETAEVLGIQPKAASIRYVRAMRRLKEIIESLSYFGN